MKTMFCCIGLFLTFCALLETSRGLILRDGHHERISRTCMHCKHTTHPEHCHSYEQCGDWYCQTEVHYVSGSYQFSFGCGDPHHCKNEQVHVQNIFGKREQGPYPPPHGPHEEGKLVCRECCSSAGCEKTSCSSILPTTPSTTTTSTTTQRPTTTTPKPTVLNPGCRDYETATFKCTDLAKFNFCHDNSSFAHAIAQQQCSKFCGFCSPLSLATSPAPVITTTKQAVTATHAPAPVTTTQAPIPCSDNEIQDFNCAEWKAFGFCSDTSGSGYNIAKERCQKTCGFCH